MERRGNKREEPGTNVATPEKSQSESARSGHGWINSLRRDFHRGK